MIVLVDLDGVVADWGYGYNRQLSFFGLESFGPYESRQGWDLTAGMTEEQRRIHANLMRVPGFYRDLPPIEGAIDAIWKLIAEGHTPFFVSTPYRSHETCASEKLAWVGEHFGQTMQSRTILTEDKTVVMGDVLVDDKPLIRGSNPTPTWRHLCFGNYGYSSSTLSQRVETWYDALTEITLLAWEKELTA